MVSSIYDSALKGIRAGFADIATQAQRVATAFTEKGDGNLIDPLVAIQEDKHAIKANVKVLKTAKTLEDSVLDILA